MSSKAYFIYRPKLCEKHCRGSQNSKFQLLSTFNLFHSNVYTGSTVSMRPTEIFGPCFIIAR
uniref:Uncharacterized protein n=1 Tax=Anguilla anguilla TaxID=7936 RepID=A0A0E9T512_ANGAN